jgi:protein dithiol:quinone oxidoreductase
MHKLCKAGQGLILGVTGFVLVTSFYLQYTEALLPCPLCLMQRGMTLLIFLLAFIGMFKAPRVIGMLELLFALAGAFFASRQLWLQSLPVADTGMCLPGVESLVGKLPWHELLQTFIWKGGSSCGEVTWVFAGFSMAAWSLMYFSLIGIISVFLGVKLFRDECV